MDRKKKLATAGAISLTASAAVIAVASGVGLFGLTQETPRVGKLSPIDATSATTSTTPDVQTVFVDDTTTPTAVTTPDGDDHGGDSHRGNDNRGPGSTRSGRDHDEDD